MKKNTNNKQKSSKNQTKNKIRVMIVEDSRIKQKLLTHLLNSDADITVTDIANSGEEALLKLEKNKPHIITMDINMPGMDGFETSKKILSKYSIPIVIISAQRNDKNKTLITKTARESGSLYFLDSPPSPWDPEYKKKSQQILRMVKLLSATKMVTRHRNIEKNSKNDIVSSNKNTASPTCKVNNQKNSNAKINLIAIGVSTGGPGVLQEITSQLPKDYPIPILVIQHISPGFDSILATHLNNEVPIHVKVAENGEKINKGVVYLAPGEKDMIVTNNNRLLTDRIDNNKILHPSAAEFFQSVAEHYGEHALGIILTGMGADGAKELKLIRDKGGPTIAQSEESCIVFGMPKVAIKLGSAEKILTTEEIIKTLIEVGKKVEEER